MCALACASIPKGRAAVDDIDIRGTSELGEKEIEKKLATTQSPRFLGLFQGVVFDYEVFNRFVLQRDLQRIERYYRARGFYRARVRAGRVYYVDDEHVRVEVEVDEGPPVLLRRIDIHGLGGLKKEIREAVRTAASTHLTRDERFEEKHFIDAEEAIKRALTDRGYAYAQVKRAANVDLARNTASVGFWVTPYEPAVFGEVTIEGLGDIPEAPVRRALYIEPGDTYSTTALEDAQQAALELGVFNSVKIEPQLEIPPPEQRRVPIRVRVDPSKLKQVRLGAGAQLDTLRTDVHLVTGWQHQNLFGGLRRFSVDFRPGVVLYPTRVPSFQAPTAFLPQEKLRLEFDQPGFVEARTVLLLRSEFDIYPVLITPEVDERAPVLGYRELRASVGAERTWRRLYVNPSHNVQANFPFVYLGALDPDLGSVLVSYPEILASLDFRNDRINPHYGAYLSVDLQYAGVGGAARDFKVQPELRGYVPLDDDVTLALRGSIGLLFPQNYGETVEVNALTGTPGSATRADWVRDVQITFLRGFFSGGASSNRGYAYREIGPHGVVPFFNPGQSQDDLIADCTPDSDAYRAAVCDLPLGGFTLWEANAEIRFPISGPVSAATFCDTSDVAPSEVTFRFDRLHLSCGVGGRYETPIGPVRLDVGYRIPGLQAPADAADEGHPRDVFGLPIAVAFGIGEAF